MRDKCLYKIRNKLTGKFWYLSEYNRTTFWLSYAAAWKNLIKAENHWGQENTELVHYALIEIGPLTIK